MVNLVEPNPPSTGPRPRVTPTTLIARWPTANAQSTVPLLARTITANLSGIATGRRALQIRPFRIAAPSTSSTGKGAGAGAGANAESSRNMWVLRTLGTADDMVFVWVNDPTQPTRRSMTTGRAQFIDKRKRNEGDDTTMAESEQEDEDEDEDEDDLVLETTPRHTRWTFTSLGVATNMTSSPLHVSPFDAFLQRVLLSSSSTLGSSSAASIGQPITTGSPSPPSGAVHWTPRPTAVSLDGFTFSVGGPNGTGDWEVKIATVGLKGGASVGSSKGVVVEITYLPVPYLSPNSTFIRDFGSTLFPTQALATGEIDFYEPDHEQMYEAGLVSTEQDKRGEWEWSDKHSAWAYLQLFRKEGML
ncbi:BZ3500_MvSof-1268-A1-R1_Chr1-3g01945 [Microbotryum saponariae]|uniref:BZ3500_MvSof-1268-A1-R1_Chr1-3g01945 protein n=1 Tax=Microbotryum saponariae TaxID=289078 RepID=A0A2X0L7Y6_9BASI|nr:BZ3500_MvSof-1268-A1-R1_Chr1-3g01945 [Microbotryum saponariae]SCZ94971.1 BZ3501_MvSof-1269-A2-R1_Chr1-3g01547 [Microbotryum saponariae]